MPGYTRCGQRLLIVAVGCLVGGTVLGAPLPPASAERPLAVDEGMSAEQQFQRALQYLNGSGAAGDSARGLALLRRAAERGLPRAQSNLGTIYAEGRLVPADAQQAVVWLRKAALGGWPEGQLNLGLVYENGQGVERDPVEAVKWFLRAAQKGNVEAEFDLGVAYARGDGVAADPSEALRWITLAARHGYAPARELLSAQGTRSARQ